MQMIFFTKHRKKLSAAIIALSLSCVFLASGIQTAVATETNGYIPSEVQAANNAADPQTKAAVAENTDGIVCIETFAGVMTGVNFAGCAARIAFVFLQFTSWFVYFAAIAFNASIDYGLNMTTFLNDVPIVDLGWRTFRDLTSIFFVFIILYIAINTILGNSSYGIKALLGKVIMGAILINFSLFFTKVVIDASNVVALQFYAKIMQTAKDSNTADKNATDDWDSGISAQFANAMGLQTVWSTGATGTSSMNQIALSSGNMMIVGFMGGIFMLSTATVFLAGAIMFVIRSLVFVFLMTLSPLAFMGGILPSTKKYVGVWWSKLFSNAIFAPVYMVLMYTTLAMVLGPSSSMKANFIDMFRGDFNFTGTVLTFVILNALMLGCLMVASKLGATGAGWATELASKATFGGAAWAGRNTIGRALDAAANSDTLKNSNSWIGRSALRASRWGGSASFDLRNAPGGTAKRFGLGSGSSGGFTKAQDDKAKARTEFGKSMDAPGQRAYAASLAGRWGRANKKASDDIYKAALTDEISKHNEQIKELEDNPQLKEYERLSKKQQDSPQKMSAEETRKLGDLEVIAEATNVKEYKTFDSSTGTWSKQKDKKYRDSATGTTVLSDMKKARTEAQTYLRNKGWKKS